ncbi:MAG: hypothetical protein AB8G96_06870 [Phycisphaerales bacterium]
MHCISKRPLARRPRATLIACLAITGAAVAGTLVTAAAAGDVEQPTGGPSIDWWSVDGGGGASGGGDWSLTAAIGQADAGPMAGGEWLVDGGFWAGGAATLPACPNDVDGSGVVDFVDLLSVLSNFGVCPGCPADVDGNGVVDFVDILNVLGDFGPC